MVGCDLEWPVSFKRGQPASRVALVQICTETDVFLFHVAHTGLPEPLALFMADPNIAKGGVGLLQDCRKLRNDFGCVSRGLTDLGRLARRRLRRSVMDGFGLAALCETLLKKRLAKPSGLRTGGWDRATLAPEQRRYAALDAYASLRVMQVLQKLPDRFPEDTTAPCAEGLSCLPPVPAMSPQRALVSLLDGTGGEPIVARSGNIAANRACVEHKSNPNGLASDSPVPDRTAPPPERLQPSIAAVFERWKGCGSVRTVARERGVLCSTVISYLARAIRAGYGYDWARLRVDDTLVARVKAAADVLRARGDQPTCAAVVRAMTGKENATPVSRPEAKGASAITSAPTGHPIKVSSAQRCCVALILAHIGRVHT
jgi:hypothetical protein